MKCQMYGYVRVSTKEQNIDRQMTAMRRQGIPEQRIFVDKQSGRDFERPAYRQLMGVLLPGDTVFIKSIDRLGRNYREIMEQWNRVVLEKRAQMVVLDMPLLDTRTKPNDPTGTLISGLALQILSYVAETERKNLRQRQAEGILEAKARGVRFGRERRPLPSEFQETVQRWRSKDITCQEALRTLNMGRTSFYQKVKEMGL